MEVLVYSSNSCGYCVQQKDFLLKNGIEYEERDIAKDEYFQELIEIGGRGTPFTLIKEEGNIIATVSGFNKDELYRLLIQE